MSSSKLENDNSGEDRLRKALREALDRQKATNEILHLISSSPNDTQPVFEAIVKSGSHLFPDSAISVAIPFEDTIDAVAVADEDPARAESWRQRFPIPLNREYMHGVAFLDAEEINIADVANSPQANTAGAINFLQSGFRAVTMMPMLLDGKSVGVISVLRRSTGSLSDHQVAILRTFAAQAVIAIENVRQFRAIQTANSELQARLERESATREILSVISQSRDDDKPVFDVIVETAARLCHAQLANLNIVDEERTYLTLVSEHGEPLGSIRPGHKWDLSSNLVIARAAREAEIVHVHDLAEDDLYRSGDPMRRKVVDEGGARTFLAVPLISGRHAIGAMGLMRREPKPFEADEIALVESFAAQAVIAIENVRQFKALEQRTKEVQALNADLEGRVEAQVGEIERMGRLKRFLPPQVADAVVSAGDEKILASHRALISVLFCDIRGFTAFCETAEPEETIDVLQTYHEEMGALIAEYGAGVDHRSGDGIMVIFNDPLPCEDPPGSAVRLALAMRGRMEELCKGWRKLGYRLGFGVGISIGYATVGMVGSEGRYEYTASGTAVNLGARLCDQAEDGEILLSLRAATAVEEDFRTEAVGHVDLKGIREPVEIFRLIGPQKSGA